MIGSINRTKSIIQKYDIKAKKTLGQNFLVDENILQKTVAFSQITKNDGAIEIGPGIGALTEVLLMKAKKVLAYEIDDRFISILQNELTEQDRLLIKKQDFLKANLQEDLQYFADCEHVYVISNIPYYITTPIITYLLQGPFIFKSIILLMQKEVGLRLVAKPSTKDYSAFSVFMQTKSNVRLAFYVSANCFIPKPDVDSVVVEIIPKPNQNEPKFFSFVQNIFQNRRKTLINNLLRTYNFPRLQLEDILKQLNLNVNIRSENLDLKQINDLYQAIRNM